MGESDGASIDQLLCNQQEVWSGRGDLNARPPAPKAGALPGCATPRHATPLILSYFLHSRKATESLTHPAPNPSASPTNRDTPERVSTDPPPTRTQYRPSPPAP